MLTPHDFGRVCSSKITKFQLVSDYISEFGNSEIRKIARWRCNSAFLLVNCKSPLNLVKQRFELNCQIGVPVRESDCWNPASSASDLVDDTKSISACPVRKFSDSKSAGCWTQRCDCYRMLIKLFPMIQDLAIRTCRYSGNCLMMWSWFFCNKLLDAGAARFWTSLFFQDN